MLSNSYISQLRLRLRIRNMIAVYSASTLTQNPCCFAEMLNIAIIVSLTVQIVFEILIRLFANTKPAEKKLPSPGGRIRQCYIYESRELILNASGTGFLRGWFLMQSSTLGCFSGLISRFTTEIGAEIMQNTDFRHDNLPWTTLIA